MSTTKRLAGRRRVVRGLRGPEELRNPPSNRSWRGKHAPNSEALLIPRKVIVHFKLNLKQVNSRQDILDCRCVAPGGIQATPHLVQDHLSAVDVWLSSEDEGLAEFVPYLRLHRQIRRREDCELFVVAAAVVEVDRQQLDPSY